MTIHVISVGVNLLDAFDDPGRFGAQERAVRTGRARMQALVPQGPDSTAADSALRTHLASPAAVPPDWSAVIATTRPERWPDTVSAEVQTFTAAGAARPVDHADVVFLIATDTAQGLLAALWNALALTGDPGRVRYLPDPAAAPTDPRGTAVIVRVPGMDAGDDTGFRTAMRVLGTFGGTVLALVAHHDEPIRLHLSGGFKVSIPYLLALAEAMRSRHQNITACMAHESALLPDGRPRAPIDLPLRRINAKVLHDELAVFADDGFAARPPDELILDGYAYDKTGEPRRGYRLTPFGEGLRALVVAEQRALEP